MKRMHAEKMKILLISVLFLMLLPFAAFGEYSISHSYGSMAPTRIRELLRHGECFYAIVDEPQGLFGNHVIHKIKEIVFRDIGLKTSDLIALTNHNSRQI